MRTILAVTVVLALSPALGAGDKPARQQRVLVVHSYHEGQLGHVDEMTAGIEDALAGSGAQIEYVYMDTKRHSDLEWKQQAGVLAARRVEDFKPDVVITMDDNAQEFFAAEYAKRPDSPPFVFSGVNGKAEKFGFPRDNVTGVLERPNLVESLELLQKIVPSVKRVVMLSDKSPTTDGCWDYAKTLKLPVEVVAYEQPLTFDEWKAVVLKYQDSADAFGIYVSRTVHVSAQDETCVPDTELIAWLNEHNKLPTVGFFDTSAKIGIMCGICVSMREQGYVAGKIARGILEGKHPNDFTIAPTTNGRIMLNLKTAEALGIKVRYGIIQNAEEVIR